MNRQVLLYAAIVLVVLLGYLGISMQESIWVPDRLPYFELNQLDYPHKKMTRKSLAGRWVLLNFWASWCHVCDSEAEHLATFKSADVAVIGVVTRDSLQAVVASDKARLRGPEHMIDENGDLFSALGFDGLPASVLINPDGEIVLRVKEPLRVEILQKIIDKIKGS